MLISFSCRNFRSLRDEQVLDLAANKDPSLEGNTFPCEALGDLRLVSSAAIYGANASGKSNLISAVSFMGSFVRGSANEYGPGDRIPVRPFLLDDSARKPTELEVSFVHHGVRYQYGFQVDRRRVLKEWLLAYPKGSQQRWFERSVGEGGDDEDTWWFGPHLKGEKNKLKKLTRPNALFLSVAASFNHEQLTTVYSWFDEYLRVFGSSSFGMRLPRLGSGLYTAHRSHQETAFQKRVLILLRDADTGIEDLVTETHPFDEDEALAHLPEQLRRAVMDSEELMDSEVLEVRTTHRNLTTGQAVHFKLADESDGTQRLFSLGGPWLDTLDSGYTLFVDELDSSLHPHLSRRLVELFHRPEENPKGAQLIFTTHDTSLLEASLLRRDQVWFTEKDAGGVSRLYPLTDYHPRKEEALRSGYLAGRYGAVPILGGAGIR